MEQKLREVAEQRAEQEVSQIEWADEVLIEEMNNEFFVVYAVITNEDEDDDLYQINTYRTDELEEDEEDAGWWHGQQKSPHEGECIFSENTRNHTGNQLIRSLNMEIQRDAQATVHGVYYLGGRRARGPEPVMPTDLEYYRGQEIGSDISHETYQHQKIANRATDEIAVWCRNGLVIDTQFDTTGRAAQNTSTDTLSVPFDILEEHGVTDKRKINIIEQRGSQVLFVHKGEFYLRGSSEGRLSQYDDGWLAEIDNPVQSIEEAFETEMKPDSVIAAEENDRDVYRQGDWFFVEQHDDWMPSAITRTPELQPEGLCDYLDNHRAEWLGHDALAPDRVLVKGTLSHENDDHPDLTLPEGEWFEAKHNQVTSTSFQCEEFEAPERTWSHGETTGRLM